MAVRTKAPARNERVKGKAGRSLGIVAITRRRKMSGSFRGVRDELRPRRAFERDPMLALLRSRSASRAAPRQDGLSRERAGEDRGGESGAGMGPVRWFFGRIGRKWNSATTGRPMRARDLGFGPDDSDILASTLPTKAKKRCGIAALMPLTCRSAESDGRQRFRFPKVLGI